MSPEDTDIGDEPLEFGHKPVSFPKIPAEMVDSIALGMEDELVVAARHGFSVEQYRRLEKLRPFQVAVASRRADFEKQGLTFKLKRSMQADDLWDDVYLMAKGSNVPLMQKAEVATRLAKLGGLEPKEEKGAGAAGPGFQISINLGGSAPLTLNAGPVIEAKTRVIEE